MFSIFKKKQITVDDLVKSYRDQVTAIGELEQAKSSVKTEAIESGSPDLDAVAKALDRLDLEVELHRQAAAEVRTRLEAKIRIQLAGASAEMEERRQALDAELKSECMRAGALFGELVGLLGALPFPFATTFSANLNEHVDAIQKRFGSQPELALFLDGFAQAEPVLRDYRAEKSALTPAVNAGTDPERKVKITVDKLLGEFKPAPASGLFGLGVK